MNINKHHFGYLLLIVCTLVCCKPKEQNNFTEVAKIVNETETIIHKYDSTVAVALENKKIDFIEILSKGAMDSTNLKLNDLKRLEIYPINEELRVSSIGYVASLQKLIAAESKYSLISDTTSFETAKQMDDNVSKEINTIEQMRYKYRLVLKKAIN